MRTVTICCVLLGLLLCWHTVTAQAADPMLAHDVYFTLKHDSDDAKEKLLAGCKKYLAGHPGVVWFAAGILVEDHQRDVNDRDFDSFVNVSSHAGMVRGRVVAKYDSGDFALAVAHVIDQWQHSKAENPKSLIGKTVLVNGR